MGAYAIARNDQVPVMPPLVRRAREGDLAAFEELYRRHVGRVHALCLRLTGDPGRAEELTQDTFVRAWQRFSSLRGETGFAAWLRRVAVNVVLSDHRARGRRPREQVVETETQLGPAPVRERAGKRLDLEQAIAGLPPGAREVFVLHDVEGYRHGEIGKLLGIADGTSKAQLHRARKLLREVLR